jgi:hypothetical protein
MEMRPVPSRPLLGHVPAPARRAAGAMLLTLTLWLASLVALFQ